MCKVNIRTDKFTKKELKVIEQSLKEWNYDWIVEIIYVAESNNDNVDATSILDKENLGEFLWVIFGCGHESVFNE